MLSCLLLTFCHIHAGSNLYNNNLIRSRFNLFMPQIIHFMLYRAISIQKCDGFSSMLMLRWQFSEILRSKWSRELLWWNCLIVIYLLVVALFLVAIYLLSLHICNYIYDQFLEEFYFDAWTHCLVFYRCNRLALDAYKYLINKRSFLIYGIIMSSRVFAREWKMNIWHTQNTLLIVHYKPDFFEWVDYCFSVLVCISCCIEVSPKISGIS